MHAKPASRPRLPAVSAKLRRIAGTGSKRSTIAAGIATKAATRNQNSAPNSSAAGSPPVTPASRATSRRITAVIETAPISKATTTPGRAAASPPRMKRAGRTPPPISTPALTVAANTMPSSARKVWIQVPASPGGTMPNRRWTSIDGSVISARPSSTIGANWCQKIAASRFSAAAMSNVGEDMRRDIGRRRRLAYEPPAAMTDRL